MRPNSAPEKAGRGGSGRKQPLQITITNLWEKSVRHITSRSHRSWLWLRIETDFHTEDAVGAPPQATAISCAFLFLAPFVFCFDLAPILSALLGEWTLKHVAISAFSPSITSRKRAALCDVGVLLRMQVQPSGLWLELISSINNQATTTTKKKSENEHQDLLCERSRTYVSFHPNYQTMQPSSVYYYINWSNSVSSKEPQQIESTLWRLLDEDVVTGRQLLALSDWRCRNPSDSLS